jgi:hypothetical protein
LPFLLHQRREAVEQVADVVRAGRGLRVALEAERRRVGARQALQVPSNRLTWRGAHVAGSAFSSTAKPWFWLVMLTRPLSRSFTGWLAPWWPNFILKVLGARGQRQDLVAQADAEGGRAAGEQFAHGLDGVVAGLGVAGAVAEEDAVGLSFSTSAAGVVAGTTVTRQPRLASMRRMLRLTPKS